jgi:hypothetical protein
MNRSLFYTNHLPLDQNLNFLSHNYDKGYLWLIVIVRLPTPKKLSSFFPRCTHTCGHTNTSTIGCKHSKLGSLLNGGKSKNISALPFTYMGINHIGFSHKNCVWTPLSLCKTIIPKSMSYGLFFPCSAQGKNLPA